VGSSLQTPRSYAPAGSVAVTEVLALSACRRQHLTRSRGCGNRGPRFRGAYTGLGTLTPRALSAGGAFAIVPPSLTLYAARQAQRTSFSPAHRFPMQGETVHQYDLRWPEPRFTSIRLKTMLRTIQSAFVRT
jgi:hypothetical protein